MMECSSSTAGVRARTTRLAGLAGVLVSVALALPFSLDVAAVDEGAGVLPLSVGVAAVDEE